MARRRHEHGLKKKQRIEREQHDTDTADSFTEPDATHSPTTNPEPAPPGATQMLENMAPPLLAPGPDER